MRENKLLFCFSEVLCQDEEGNAYFDGATWTVGDCIGCRCDKGIISCSRQIMFITSDDVKTEHCNQTVCNVATFVKTNKGICKGKYAIETFNCPGLGALSLLLSMMLVRNRLLLPPIPHQNLSRCRNNPCYSWNTGQAFNQEFSVIDVLTYSQFGNVASHWNVKYVFHRSVVDILH